MRSNFLKKVRLENNYSIEQVVSKCDISEDELKQIEVGNVTEQDMSSLFKLSELYDIAYIKLLQLFKLVENKPEEQTGQMGMAAYHDQKLSKQEQDEISHLIDSLKDL